jgi:hypothetical protein
MNTSLIMMSHTGQLLPSTFCLSPLTIHHSSLTRFIA